MKLSVIVPVYNCEAWLRKCLDSLVNQKLDESYEIIVVNDGSPDNSQAIIDEYSENYAQLRGYYKTNGGLSDARNYGLQYASGEFIAFVDSDDWVDLDFYSKGINLAEQNNYDVVVYDIVDHYPSYTVHHKCSEFTNKFHMTMNANNKLFKKSVIEGMKFAVGLWYEDLEFTSRVLFLNDNIGRIHDSFYHCHCRETSIMSNDNSPKNLDLLKVFDIIQEDAKKKEVYEKYKETFDFMIINHVLITGINRVTKQNHPERESVIRKMREYVIENVSDVNAVLNNKEFSKSQKIIAKLNFKGYHHVSEKILKISAKMKGK